MIQKLTSLFIILLFSFTAQAHDVFSGEAKMTITEQKQLRVEYNFASVTADVFSQDIIDRNNQISPGNLPKIHDHLAAKAKQFMRVTLDGKPLKANHVDIQIITSEDAVVFNVTYPGPITPGRLDFVSDFIEQTNREYKLTIPVLNEKGTQLGLFVHNWDHRLDGIQITQASYTAKKENEEGVFALFLELGVEHILIGFDHLVFLLGLLIICRNWKHAALIITCFTLAHSVTLSLASLNIVTVPAKWTELIIALSIVYVGLENLWTKHHPHFRWILTSVFGLIHGLGFANVLMDIGLGADGAPVFVPLLAFNLGVEIGQLSLAIITLPIMWYLLRYKTYQKVVMPLISLSIVLLGSFWAFERIA